MTEYLPCLVAAFVSDNARSPNPHVVFIAYTLEKNYGPNLIFSQRKYQKYQNIKNIFFLKDMEDWSLHICEEWRSFSSRFLKTIKSLAFLCSMHIYTCLSAAALPPWIGLSEPRTIVHTIPYLETLLTLSWLTSSFLCSLSPLPL